MAFITLTEILLGTSTWGGNSSLIATTPSSRYNSSSGGPYTSTSCVRPKKRPNCVSQKNYFFSFWHLFRAVSALLRHSPLRLPVLVRIFLLFGKKKRVFSPFANFQKLFFAGCQAGRHIHQRDPGFHDKVFRLWVFFAGDTTTRNNFSTTFDFGPKTIKRLRFRHQPHISRV